MAQLDLYPAIWQTGFVVLTIALLHHEARATRGLRAFTSSARRLSVYRSGVVSLWILALGAILLVSPTGLATVRPAASALTWLAASALTVTIAAVVSVAYFALAFGPALHCRLRPAARPRYQAAVKPVTFMLPVSDSERRWWVLVSISAGVCEEAFFRGFLPQFFSGDLHGGWHMDSAAAWLFSALAFGIAHLYQGAAGVARTAVAGLMFSLLAISTGNLLLPIVIHVLVDLSLLWVYRPQADDPAAAALLIQGCAPT